MTRYVSLRLIQILRFQTDHEVWYAPAENCRQQTDSNRRVSSLRPAHGDGHLPINPTQEATCHGNRDVNASL
jgi:hypothetical protein